MFSLLSRRNMRFSYQRDAKKVGELGPKCKSVTCTFTLIFRNGPMTVWPGIRISSMALTDSHSDKDKYGVHCYLCLSNND